MGIQGMMHLLAPYCTLSSYVAEEDCWRVSGPRNENTHLLTNLGVKS